MITGIGCKSANINVKPPPQIIESIRRDTIEVEQSATIQKVDILVVIDTSSSMNHHQQKLGAKFGELISSLSQVDWQMAFINADDSTPIVNEDGYHGAFYHLEDAQGEIRDAKGNLVKILTNQLQNPQELFLNTINRNGKSSRAVNAQTGVREDSGVEVPLRNIKNAIDKRNEENEGFFRDNAALAVIILSNEDELSNGLEITNAQGEVTTSPTQPSEVIQTVRGAFGENKNLSVYGIIVQPDDQSCMKKELERYKLIDTEGEPIFSTFIANLAAGRGSTYSICDDDYSETLVDISNRLEAILNLTEVNLRYENVVEESITLDFTPAENAVSGSFDEEHNKYVFDQAPASGTTINIQYSYIIQKVIE